MHTGFAWYTLMIFLRCVKKNFFSFQCRNRNYNVHPPEKCISSPLLISTSCLLAISHDPSCLWANHELLLAYPHQSESSTQSWLNGYGQYWLADGQLISLIIDKQIDTTLTNRHIYIETHSYTHTVRHHPDKVIDILAQEAQTESQSSYFHVNGGCVIVWLGELHSRLRGEVGLNCLKQMFSSIASYN